MKDAYERFGCEFKNESECDEELDEEGIDYGEIKEEHFKIE